MQLPYIRFDFPFYRVCESDKSSTLPAETT